MTVSEARDEWYDILERIELARVDLRCSVSTAWFRGHGRSDWTLRPQRVRDYVDEQLPMPVGLSLKKKSMPEPIEKGVFRLLNKPYWLKLRLEANQRALLEELSVQMVDRKEHWEELNDDIARLKFLESEARKAKVLNVRPQDFEGNLPEFLNKYKLPHTINENGVDLRHIDSDKIGVAYGRLEAKIGKLKEEFSERKEQLEQIVAVTAGEQDAFTDFNFRSREPLGTSWQVLAKMQHYKVDTRLLDWSESLVIALSFAIRKYLDHYQTEAQLRATASGLEGFIEKCTTSIEFHEAAIFVLNPYSLMRLATGENKLLDLTLEKDLDYYQRFFVQKKWPFSYPLPTYSSWRDERLASQHGMFTVHGTDLRAIEEQKGAVTFVRKLTISRQAAAFGARHLVALFPIDRFSLFRDLDSLGKKVSDKYKPH